MADDENATWQEFRDTVNMTAGELEKWLGTEGSKIVGQKDGAGSQRATPAADASSNCCGPRNRN
jgi:hypothetical protein